MGIMLRVLFFVSTLHMLKYYQHTPVSIFSYSIYVSLYFWWYTYIFCDFDFCVYLSVCTFIYLFVYENIFRYIFIYIYKVRMGPGESWKIMEVEIEDSGLQYEEFCFQVWEIIMEV